MRQIFVELRFWNCAATTVEDVVAWAQVLQRHDITLLAHRTLEPLPTRLWYETFQKEYENEEYNKSSVAHRIAFADWGKLAAGFRFDEYRQGGNKLEIGVLLDFQFQDQRPLVEPLAQRLLAIAQDLYPLAHPTYGEVEGNSDWESRDVARFRLKHISWANFFGPVYVEKYGQDFLLGLPGYKTELLPDGGVFHQLASTFVAPSEAEAQRLRREVIAYCAQHGLKVTCKAPFVIPGWTAQGKPPKGLSEADLEGLLAHILAGATLVLKDGTRVRVLRIPWGDLTEGQRERVLAAIRQAAVQAIRTSGGARVRFEFNAVPDDLDALLRGLAGPENPWFEWAEVPDLG